MATTIYEFSPTIPAQTPQASPVTLSMAFPVYQVDRLDIRIPRGPNGCVGFWIGSQGQQIIPFQTGQYIVGNDETLSWDLENYPTSGSWELTGYNVGYNPHTIYVRFLLSVVSAGAAAAPVVIAAASLSS